MPLEGDLTVGASYRTTCPLCDTEFTAFRWIVIDIDSRPELAVRACDGSLQRSFCPACVGPGVEQRGSFCIVRRLEGALQIENFFPWGVVDATADAHAMSEAIRERCAALGVPVPAFEYLGSCLVRNAADVARTVADNWPDLKMVFDPTIVPDAVSKLLSATTTAERVRVLLRHPDLLRPNAHRFLAALNRQDDPAHRERATTIMTFLDLARAVGVHELPTHRVPSSPPPEQAGAPADAPGPATIARWLDGIERGELGAVCEEIDAAQKGSERYSPAGVLNDLGTFFSDRDNTAIAIELLQRAAMRAGQGGNTVLNATIEGNLGNAFFAAGRFEEARPHFVQAAALYSDAGDVPWRVMMLVSVGNCLDDLNRTDAACAQYEEAAAVARAAGAVAEASVAVGNLGNVFGTHGDFTRARAHHAEALDLAWQSGDQDRLLKVAGDLAMDLRSLGESGSAEAEALAAKAAEAWKQARHRLGRAGLDAASLLLDESLAPIQLADVLDADSTFAFGLGDVDAAIAASRRAVDLARGQQDEGKTAEFLVNLSAIYLSARQVSAAFTAANDAFAHARKGGSQSTTAKALGNLGIACQYLGQFSLAQSYLTQQRQLALDANDEPQQAVAANALSTVYERLGFPGRAAELLNEASSLAEQHGLETLATSCLINRAINAGRRGVDRETQAALYREAIARAIRADNADQHADAAINLARVRFKDGDLDDVERLLNDADGFVSQDDFERRATMAILRADAARKAGRSIDAMHLYQAAGYALHDGDPERSAECFVDAASLALQQLTAAEQSAAAAIDPEHQALLIDRIVRETELAVSTYETLAQKLDDFRLWGLVQRQENAFRLYTDIILKRDGPGSALAVVERGKGRALRQAMYRRLAGQRTSAFDYAQVMRRTSFDMVTRMPSANIELTPDQFEQMFATLSRTMERKEPEIPNLDETQLRSLAATLGAPVVEFAFGTADTLHTWVVTSDDIHFVDITLETVGGRAGLHETIAQLRETIGITRDLGVTLARPAKNARPLLETLYALLIGPIESWLPDTTGASVCLVPDGPLFEVPFTALQSTDGRAVLDRWTAFEVPAMHFLAVTPEEPGSGLLIAGDPTRPPAAEKDWGPIPPLPFARDEAIEVARLHGAAALVGGDATKRAIEAALASAELIHLAAHAILSPTSPLDSAIVLAAGDEDDGLIRIREIDAKTLQSRLVILSCCSTGRGVVTGDGVLSLGRGLLAAGAHTVLASLWAVNDESTRFTMVDFHKRLVADPFHASIATMFRESQLATRETYPHHAQWAPFVLWGWPHCLRSAEWRRPVETMFGTPVPPLSTGQSP